jgi:hypothetical protein
MSVPYSVVMEAGLHQIAMSSERPTRRDPLQDPSRPLEETQPDEESDGSESDTQEDGNEGEIIICSTKWPRKKAPNDPSTMCIYEEKVRQPGRTDEATPTRRKHHQG